MGYKVLIPGGGGNVPVLPVPVLPVPAPLGMSTFLLSDPPPGMSTFWLSTPAVNRRTEMLKTLPVHRTSYVCGKNTLEVTF